MRPVRSPPLMKTFSRCNFITTTIIIIIITASIADMMNPASLWFPLDTAGIITTITTIITASIAATTIEGVGAGPEKEL